MTPRLRKNRPLRFAEDFCFEDFEFLCRDLMEKESGIGSAALYGAPPQGQHGIDIIGYHSDGECCDVAQCKNYRGFKKADLTKMLKKFWASWDYWQSKKVRRFILCVGGPARDAKLQDEIQAERPRFLAKGIAFEVWDDATLTARLAANPSLAYLHCDEAVAKQLCGPIVEVGDVGRATLALFQTTLEECGGEFEQTMEKELPRIRETARCGHAGEAFDAMAELRASPRWRLLDARTRARGLRLAASLHLDHKDDVATAKSLIAEGARLAPEASYQVIEAAIAYREAGVEIALKILDSPRDLDAWNIRLALLVEAGRLDEVVAAIEAAEFSPNAGSYRVASIAALLLRDLAKAKTFSDAAMALSPEWFQVRLQAARMKYSGTLLPSYPLLTHISWPIPPDLEYVRRDAESVTALRLAAAEFEALAAYDSGERRHIEAWRLACLANLPAGRDAAAKYAAELLTRDPAHLPAAVWCLQRGFPVNKASLLCALTPQPHVEGTPDTAQAICQIHIQSGDFTSAVAQLDSARAVFVAHHAEFAWRHMRVQLSAALGEDGEVQRFIDEEPSPELRRDMRIAVARVKARQTGDFNELARVAVDAYRETQTPKYLLEAAEASLESGDARFVADNADEILRHFPTAAALQLVVQGCFRAGRFSHCLRLLRTHRSLFVEGSLSEWVRRVEVDCLRQVGELAAAVENAMMLVQESPGTENLFTLFNAQVAVADFRASAHTARQLLVRKDVTAAGLLHVARTIYFEDYSVARDGLEAAIQRGLNSEELAAAVWLGFQIGAEATIAPLMPDFFALAGKPNAPVKAFSFPEIKEMMQSHANRRDEISRLFGEGRAPVHLVAKALHLPLAALFHEQPRIAREERQPLRHFPLLIRS